MSAEFNYQSRPEQSIQGKVKVTDLISRLNEEKNFSSLIKLTSIYIHFYSHLSFFLLKGDLSAPLLRETSSKREREICRRRERKKGGLGSETCGV